MTAVPAAILLYRLLAGKLGSLTYMYINILNSFIQIDTSNNAYPCDGIFLEVGRLCCEVRPGPFVLLLEAHAIPMVSQRGGLALPVLQKGHSCQEGGHIY